MRNTTNFEAFYDDYYKIVVYLSKDFYNGISKSFYLRDHNGCLTTCVIANQVIKNDCIKYTLSLENKLSIDKKYEIVEEHALATPLKYGLIVKTEMFDDQFYYDGTDLGSTYTPNSTSFALWAPLASNVIVQIEKYNRFINHSLVKTENGVFRCVAEGDFDGAYYTYLANVNGDWVEISDPYGNATNANGFQTLIVNPEKVNIDLNKENLPKLKRKTDAIIYEISIRDFSILMKGKLKSSGKFKGVVERGYQVEGVPTLFDHLVNLGITHLQIQPIHDFATVDELNIDQFYNWGYDPVSYHSIEGSYSSNPEDGYSRIREFKQMVATCHEHGIRIVLDLVYNHYYDFKNNNLQKLTPNYFFQIDKDGNLSNGSFCGNDYDSSTKMGAKYLIDCCLNWVKEYGVDGFRFDLMGINDYRTINQIYMKCKNVDENFMVYGEGWNMPSMLDNRIKASMLNYQKMPNISFFNDFYRDSIKGSTDEKEMYKKGYFTGDFNYFNAVKSALSGNCTHVNGEVKFLNPSQTINYLECHDNATLWDKIRESCKGETREDRMKRQKIMIGAVLVSQGVPFLHSGQEFARTKYGIHNSYRSNDEINKLDWSRCAQNYDTVKFTADLINLRKQYNCLRFDKREQIEKHVEIKELSPGILHYILKDIEEYDDARGLEVVFNCTFEQYTLDFQERINIKANENGAYDEAISAQIVSIPALSILVIERPL